MAGQNLSDSCADRSILFYTEIMQRYFIPPFGSHDENTDRLVWLVLLRWLMILGQITVVAVGTQLLFIPFAIAPWMILSSLGLGMVNAMVCKSLHHPLKKEWRETQLLGVLLLDMVHFLFFMALTQGIQNPFYPLIFVHVTLSAILLPTGYAWAYLTVMGAGIYVMNPVVYVFNEQGTYIRTSALVSWGIQMFVILANWMLAAAVSRHRLRYQQRWEKLQRQQMHLQKVHLLGALGAGVAHEFASPLNTLRLRLDRLYRKAPETLITDIQAARKALQQSEERLQALAALPTQADLQALTPIDPTAIILPLWEQWKAKHPRIQWTLAQQMPHSLQLTVPPLLLEHTVNNLIKNAVKALSSECSDGEQEAVLSSNPPQIILQLEQTNQTLCLAVHDNGPGWPDVILKHLGEPFLTTAADGTGLGLYTVFMLAQSMGGELKLIPHSPKGASARLCLPMTPH